MMIEVNLLPAEFRRVEHTPLPRFLVVIIGTAAVMATAAFGVVVNVKRVPGLEAKEAQLVVDIRTSEKQAARYDELLDEIADTKNRKNTIADLWRSRITWSRKMAQMAEMTPNFIGFSQMKLEEARGGGKTEENGGVLTIDSICAGTDHKRVANFRRIVQGEYRLDEAPNPWVGRDFYNDSFMALLPNSTRKKEVKDYVETEALEFQLGMPLKGESDRLKAATAEAIAREKQKQAAEQVPAGRRTKTSAAKQVSASKPLESASVEAETEPGAPEPASTADDPAKDTRAKAVSDMGKAVDAEMDVARELTVLTGAPSKTTVPENTKPAGSAD